MNFKAWISILESYFTQVSQIFILHFMGTILLETMCKCCTVTVLTSALWWIIFYLGHLDIDPHILKYKIRLHKHSANLKIICSSTKDEYFKPSIIAASWVSHIVSTVPRQFLVKIRNCLSWRISFTWGREKCLNNGLQNSTSQRRLHKTVKKHKLGNWLLT